MEKTFSEDGTTKVSPVPSNDVNYNEAELTLWQAVRKYKKLIFYCLGLSSAVILYGYDQAIVGSVSGLPAFQRDFGQLLGKKYILPSLWLGLWNVGTPIGVMIGAVIGGFFQDRFGRRMALGFGSLLAAFGIAVMFVCFATNDVLARRGLFLGGKVLQGIGIGTLMATTQTYMSEVLPPVLRGPILSFITIFAFVGQLIGAFVVYGALSVVGARAYTICFGSQWPFSLVTLLVAFLLPESPSYLIRKNRLEAAHKAQTRLNPPGAHTDSIVERLRITIEEERANAKSTYAESFKGVNLRRSLIIIFCGFLPQSFGLTLLAKASYFLQVVGMEAKLSVTMVIVGVICGLVGNAISFWTLSKFGRRSLIITTLTFASVIWFTIGVAGCFKGAPTVWYTAIGMLVVITACGVGAWPASVVVASEVSALHLRGKAQGIAWFTNGFTAGFMGFILPYVFNPDQGNLRAKTGFVYGALAAVHVVIAWFIVPEMKGRTFVTIDRMFHEHVGARDFKNYRDEHSSVEEEL